MPILLGTRRLVSGGWNPVEARGTHDASATAYFAVKNSLTEPQQAHCSARKATFITRTHRLQKMRNILLLALLPLSDALAAPVLRAVSSVTSPLAPIFDKLARASAGNYDVPAVRAAIHRERQSAPVVIFGYELSPFCGRARQMLEDEGVHESQIKIVSLGAAPSLPGLIAEPAMVAELANMYGAGLPCCFVDGESIGDFKQLAAAADDGSLRRRLDDAGALDP